MKEIISAQKSKPSVFRKVVTVAAGAGAALLATATASMADLATLFAGVDVTGVDTNVTTIMVAFVGIGIMYFGYRLLRRLGVAA